MRILIVEDDFDASQLLSKYLADLGDCEIVGDGSAGVAAFRKASRERDPFDLVCLDIMMPAKDGHATLQEIRTIEERQGLLIGEGSKVLMTSALSGNSTILKTFMELCDAYLVKPFSKQALLDKLEEIGILSNSVQNGADGDSYKTVK